MTETTKTTTADSELIRQADWHYKEEQLSQAARCLRRVQDKSLLTAVHHKLIKKAIIIDDAVKDLLSTPMGEWKKQGEFRGRYDTSIYYKIESGARLTCRMESPIPSSLLVPILSVLNESSLYHTWIPSWTTPVKIGVRQSNQLINDTRGHQIIQVQCDVPWPFTPREVVMDVTAVDDIDARGFIVAKMFSLEECHDLPEGFTLPPLESSMDRAEVDGAVLFRPCPTNHPNFAAARDKSTEDLVLLQFNIYFDAHMSMVPQTVINFVTRTVIGHIWNMLLHVAEQVREGKREEHRQVIEQKEDFYRWVEERCKFMFQQMMMSKQKEDSQACQDEKNSDWTLDDVLRISS